MSLYSYKKHIKKKLPVLKLVSFIMILSGLAILSSIFYPIVSFEVKYSNKFGILVNPLVAQNPPKSVIEELPMVLGYAKTDYTKASSWFPQATNFTLPITPQSDYLLYIEKLGITDAKVIIGGEDLTNSLVHFTGPAPGKMGNIVIFGHSTLPVLYNPKDYKSIFTKLPDMEPGNEINLDFDGITYTYIINSMRVTDPLDLSPLDPKPEETKLTLITCVPPGTYIKRLIVEASLKDLRI